MTDRPILFSGPMVRALLAGTKTQTRRVFKDIEHVGGGTFQINTPHGGICGLTEASVPSWAPDYLRIAVGDRLYVRETWTHTGTGVWTISDTWNARDGRVAFQADDNIPGAKYWPSIHMPKRYSRLTLTVTDVRVERLQDISEADAIAEGIEDVTREVAAGDPSLRFWKRYRDGGWNGYVDTAVGSYASLWTEINGPGSWEANPWVAAYTFTVQHGNIDQVSS